MDWPAIASILGERSDRPIVLIDQDGRIRMFNRAMEQVLGWRRFQVDGELWARVCTPPDHLDEARRWIADALRGALWSFEAHALTSGGGHVLLHLEFSLVGRGETQGLLVTTTRWMPAEPSKRVIHGRDLDYDISTEAPGFGTVTRLVVDSERIRLDEGTRCYAVLHGQEQPCDGCPVLRTDESPWPRVFVRHVQNGTASAFEIKSADRIDTGLVRIRTRMMTNDALEAIHAAKIQQLADRADLSAREREILMYLLLGRTTEDISTLVGIAVRTVKFHQANVLQKLGADSRSDLLRLLF
ncbi:MAG TPA: LuxR C-terminal-related transcriptional regulator [Kofleriaceae bacterium]|nr:LuxR C-terminal-related transcriptional regulator [Kofleriaceae bacterium]